ncbi:MAG: type II CRISPR RNA-guided endonuclease Cas9, partial [Coprobacillus cateniformis]
NMVDDKQLKMVKKLSYKDWGRLSKTFLTEIRSDILIDECTGQGQSIIESMRTRDQILMQLLRNEYDYTKKIEEFNREKQTDTREISYDLLKDLYCSPPVKRSLWQTIGIVEEIKKIMGHEPKKIFVEVTRTNKAEKKRANSRKKRLLELYKDIKDGARNWIDEIEKTEDSKFNSKKLYLYYTQMGKCMYTDNIIDIETLFTDMYDIDHIFPRSKTKDNSFDNLVLVTKESNGRKGDKYPIDPAIQKKKIDLWRCLHEKKLIGDIKFERLTRTFGFTDDELSGFIARQLVETSQSSKAAAEMLNMINKNSEVVYVKAENVSDFRHDNEFIKVREVNDHHHAKDAYLNIVVGNVYNEKFTKNPLNFIKDGGRKYSLNEIFKHPFPKNSGIIWDPEVSMETVKRMMKSNDVRVTKKIVEQKGALYDATIYKANIAKEESYFPLKMGDDRLKNVTKYGGYTSIKPAYYTIVSYDEIGSKKSEHIVRMVPIPIYICKLVNSFEDIAEYTHQYIINRSKKSIDNFKILYKKLYINSVIELNGFKYYVGGKTDDSFYIDSALDLILYDETNKLFGKIVKFYNSDFKRRSDEFINFENNMKLYDCLISKKESSYYENKKLNKLDEFKDQTTIDKFKNLSLEDQCSVLLEILNTLTDKKTTYDLKKIGINVYRAKTSMKLSSYKSFKIINQSITGLFENEIDILG